MYRYLLLFVSLILASSAYAQGTAILEGSVRDAGGATLALGGSLPPHEGDERVVYALSDLALRLKTDGGAQEWAFAAAEAHRHGAGLDAVENVGDDVAAFVVFER